MEQFRPVTGHGRYRIKKDDRVLQVSATVYVSCKRGSSSVFLATFYYILRKNNAVGQVIRWAKPS